MVESLAMGCSLPKTERLHAPERQLGRLKLEKVFASAITE